MTLNLSLVPIYDVQRPFSEIEKTSQNRHTFEYMSDFICVQYMILQHAHSLNSKFQLN